MLSWPLYLLAAYLCFLCCHPIPDYHPLRRSGVPKERGGAPVWAVSALTLRHTSRCCLFPVSPSLSCLFRLCRRGRPFVQHLVLNLCKLQQSWDVLCLYSVPGFRAAFFPAKFDRWFYTSIYEMGLKKHGPWPLQCLFPADHKLELFELGESLADANLKLVLDVMS